MMLRLMASRSMARDSASRTRTSLKGFLPLTDAPRSSSLPRSIAKKMVRVSGPSIDLSLASALSAPTSCVGTSVRRSTSPEVSAATRVGSDLIGM